MRITDKYACILGAAIAVAGPAGADIVSDWNAKACATVSAAKLNTPVANRTMAIAQTAVLEAVKSSPGASREAAVAAANHAVLTALVPSQIDAVERAYREALASIAVGDARDKGQHLLMRRVVVPRLERAVSRELESPGAPSERIIGRPRRRPCRRLGPRGEGQQHDEGSEEAGCGGTVG